MLLWMVLAFARESHFAKPSIGEVSDVSTIGTDLKL